MKKLRDLIVLLLVIAAFGISLELIRRLVGIASPWFGAMLMLDVTGLAAVARPVYLLRLPNFLRKPRAWDREGQLYTSLGVPAFGALLRNTPLRHLNSNVYLRRYAGNVAAVLAQIEAAEAAHCLAAVVLVPYIVYAIVQGGWLATVALLAVQIAYNVYPVLHLRMVRMRLGRRSLL